MKRQFKICDESNKHGPCFVVRERKRPLGWHDYIWEWVCWSRTHKEAENTARDLGEIIE